MGKAEGGTMMVADTEGRPCAKLHADEKGGTIVTTEKTGRPMTYMSANERGTVGVFSDQGDQAAVMSSDANGGAVVFYEATEKCVRRCLSNSSALSAIRRLSTATSLH